jgi:hypothetical protein
MKIWNAYSMLISSDLEAHRVLREGLALRNGYFWHGCSSWQTGAKKTILAVLFDKKVSTFSQKCQYIFPKMLVHFPKDVSTFSPKCTNIF